LDLQPQRSSLITLCFVTLIFHSTARNNESTIHQRANDGNQILFLSSSVPSLKKMWRRQRITHDSSICNVTESIYS
jgi:hypothetical protein